MSSVFGTGQSTDSMARIMKANQMSKFCASSHKYPHVGKKKSRIFVNRISKVHVLWPSRLSWEENLPQGKKKNLRAKRKASRQKENPHGKKKKFLLSIFLFAVSFFLP